MVRTWLYSVLGLTGFLLVSYLLLTYGLPLVLPFAAAILIAELLNPLITWLSRKLRLPRGLAVLAVLLLFVGLIGVVLTVAVAKLVYEVQTAYQHLPYLYALAQDLGTQFAEQFGAFHASLPESIQGVVLENLDAVQQKMMIVLRSVLSALGAVSSLPALVTNLLVMLIATFFIARDRELIFAFLIRLFPAVWHEGLRQVKGSVWRSTLGWAKAQVLLIIMTMIQSIIGLALIGSDYAVLMGVIIGVADFLPILGPAAIYLPWIAYSLIFGSKIFGIKLLILYAVVAGVRQVLEVKFVGDQIGLHPLAILLSLYLGFQFFGALGFVAGPLLAILLKAMIKSGLLPIFKEDE